MLGEPARRDAGRILRSAVEARSRHRADEDRLPPRAGAARAGVHARPAVPAAARTGQPVFKEFAAAIVPTEFMPGQGVRQRHDEADRLSASSWRRDGSRRPSNLDLATIQQQELAMAFRFHIPQYLSRRAADWKTLGFTETLDRFRRAQRALEVLGRRSARRLQELGGGRRPAQSAGRAPGRQRAHHAARAAAPGRHDGDPGEPARRAGAPAHAVAARD